jgi:hypothetical protein
MAGPVRPLRCGSPERRSWGLCNVLRVGRWFGKRIRQLRKERGWTQMPRLFTRLFISDLEHEKKELCID